MADVGDTLLNPFKKKTCNKHTQRKRTKEKKSKTSKKKSSQTSDLPSTSQKFATESLFVNQTRFRTQFGNARCGTRFIVSMLQRKQQKRQEEIKQKDFNTRRKRNPANIPKINLGNTHEQIYLKLLR